VLTGRQCRNRWINKFDEGINTLEWSIVEDLIILDSQKTLGNRWRQIAA
jgi:hypothetical protein